MPAVKEIIALDLFGPVALNAKWQAKEGAGFDMSHFRVNWKRKAQYLDMFFSQSIAS